MEENNINNVENTDTNLNDVELDYDEYIQIVNEEVKNLDVIMKNVFINDYFKGIITELHSKNWNQLKPKARHELFSKVNTYVAETLGDSILSIEYESYEELPYNQIIDISHETNTIYVNSSIFNKKNMGLTLMSTYIHKVSMHFVYRMVSVLRGYDPAMCDLAQEYYENTCESLLYGTWNNYLYPDQDGYMHQPIYVDTAFITYSIIKEYIKVLYKSFNEIDKEMSDLLYICMDAEGNRQGIIEKRNIQVQKNIKNLEHDVEEVENIQKFIEKTKQNYSKFTDDEFFELFNAHYKELLVYNDDGYGEYRMTSLSNELVKRVFRNFDLEGIDFPNYTITIQEDGRLLLDNGLGKEAPITCESFAEVISNLLIDITDIALHYGFFDFANEKEKENFFLMKEWYTLKTEEERKDPLITEIVTDGLNIANVKVTELFNNLINMIDSAIAKSEYLPRGESIIGCADKGATYDYYEFKNGKTREEVTNMLMDRIKKDLEKMKNKNNKGGR